MLSIRLNSHSLAEVTRCPKLFHYNYVISLARKEQRAALQKGSLFARVLEIYYKYKQRRGNVPMSFVTKLFKAMQGPTIRVPEKAMLAMRFMLYAGHYKNDGFRILAVELGFSVLLYQDDKYQFVYEGRPDMIIHDGKSIVVWDHKTRSRESSINEMNNQALGYCFGVGTNKLVYNYIGLQDNILPSKNFKREPILYSASQIARWHSDTVKSYYRAASYIEQNDFHRTYACEGKYSICDYNVICRQPDARSEQIVTNSDFEIVPRRNSWELKLDMYTLSDV